MSFDEQLNANIKKLNLCDDLLSNFKIEKAQEIDNALSQVGHFISQNKSEHNQELSNFCERYEALKTRNKERPTKAEMDAKEVLKTILDLIERVPQVQKVRNYPRLKAKIDAIKSKMNTVLLYKEWIPSTLQLKLNEKILELETAYQLKADEAKQQQLIIEEINNARMRIQQGINAFHEVDCNQEDAYEELLNAYKDSEVLLSPAPLFADDEQNESIAQCKAALDRTRHLASKPFQDANRTFVNLKIKELEAAVKKQDIQCIKSIQPRTLDVPFFATNKTADEQTKAFRKAYEVCDELENHIIKADTYHREKQGSKQRSNSALSIPEDKLREIGTFLDETKNAFITHDNDRDRVKLFKKETKKSFDSLRDLLVAYQNKHNNTKMQGDEILQKYEQLLLTQTNYEMLIKSNVLTALNELDKQQRILTNRRDSNKRKVEFDSAITILSELTTALDNKITDYLQTKISTEQFKTDFQQIVTEVNRDVLSSPRGDWSVTRVLDRLAEAIDAIIDFMRGQQKRTSKLAFSFLHHKTTTETIYEQLVDVVDTRMRP